MSHLDLNATVCADNLKWDRRLAAGWDFDPEYGWGAPCGTTESQWEEEGLPFPEDPEFADWFTAFYHHEALDNDTTPIPFPNEKP